MELMFIGVGVLLATLAYLIKPLRLVLITIAMLIYGLGTGMGLSSTPNYAMLISLVFGIGQIFNFARLVINRLHSRHLKLAFFIGGSRMLIAQVAFYILAKLLNNNPEYNSYIGKVILVLQVVASVLILIMTIDRLYSSRPKTIKSHYSDNELSSISILIPARNEDSDLMELLRTVVANDYPKLEILVLDDCSNSRRIPEIVKEFAQDGVRFVQGDMPKEDWLAKNQAYDTLARSSSGDWLIFMGVDVRLGVGSVRALIHYALNNNRKMISVLPRRYGGAFWSGFFTPLRYFKEMLKPGIWKFNAPALSTLWMIERGEYLKLGGMPSVARKVIPEHYFANNLNATKSYSFVRTNDYLQISTSKSLKEQLSTSIRTLYPGLHRRMEFVAGIGILMTLFLFVPFVGLIDSIFNDNGNTLLYGVIVGLLSLSHLLVTTYTNPILWPLAIVNFPYLVLQEIILYFVSMYGYEFGEIKWKERNICLPVLQAIPQLPKTEHD